MGTIDLNQLLSDMIDAASAELAAEWPKVAGIATQNFAEIADRVVQIEELKDQNLISEARARKLMQMTIYTQKSALITLSGLSVIAAEKAINAALDVARAIVNTAIGWTLF